MANTKRLLILSFSGETGNKFKEGVGGPAEPFLGWFWSRLINMISKDANIMISIYNALSPKEITSETD